MALSLVRQVGLAGASTVATVRGRLADGRSKRRRYARPIRSFSGVGLVGLPMDLNSSFSQGPGETTSRLAPIGALLPEHMAQDLSRYPAPIPRTDGVSRFASMHPPPARQTPSPADAPAAIRTALGSDHWNTYTERGLDVGHVIRDCGDAFPHNLDE